MNYYRSAVETAVAVKSGEVSPIELIDRFLDRIEERNDRSNAYITIAAEEARELAQEAERAVETDDDLGPLHGVPVALKDIYWDKAGVRTTFGAKPFAGYVPEQSAVITDRLETAGAIPLGKTNMPEFGHKPRTDNELVGSTGTPYALDRIAGGSSGGSAAALADGLATIATGSDVGGSLRVPAACCHILSVKPTFGLIPTVRRADGFSHHTPTGVVGPMARTVEDLAVLMDVLVGPDDGDPFSVPHPGDHYRAALDRHTTDLSVGYSRDLSRFTIDPAVSAVVDETIGKLADVGASVNEVEIGGPPKSELQYAFSVQATTKFATLAREVEAAFGVNLAGEDADEVSDTLVKTILMGQGHEAVEHNIQNVTRTEMYDAIEEALDGFDALICPTLAVPPFPIDEPDPTEIAGEPANGTMTDWSLPWVFNLTGHPVVSVPAGMTDDGLPVGIQLVGNRYEESTLLSVAAAVERANPWHGTYPGQ